MTKVHATPLRALTLLTLSSAASLLLFSGCSEKSLQEDVKNIPTIKQENKHVEESINTQGNHRLTKTGKTKTEAKKTSLSALADVQIKKEMPSNLRAVPAKAKMAHNTHSFESTGYAPINTQKDFNTEGYAHIKENDYKNVSHSPLSTLSIDVDTASYTNVVRMIDDENRFPPEGAVRIEEMINYFNYDYTKVDKSAKHPFSITTELTQAPWNKEHQLLLVGLQAKKIEKANLPRSNFVALVDVSGSMQGDLPLVKRSLKILARQLDKNDRLSIVTYASNIGITLEPTFGKNHVEIEKAIDSLRSGGGTNGEAGIDIAYKLARKSFIPDGNNRVLMFTDGDFNVGRTSQSEMVNIVEKEREDGIFLSIVGFGWGNTKDNVMEQMADNGNGNYSYVNDLLDAKKIFNTEMTGTLYTLGKDVKFQLEFNPELISSYRLIGYENRRLNAEDFNDDTKDAGEIGVGHTVTALYELIPQGLDSDVNPSVDSLKYQSKKTEANKSEIATVKMRYKAPDGKTSKLMMIPVTNKIHHTNNIKFASAVASFGMKLTHSKYAKDINYEQIISQAKASKGKDDEGYRAAFIRLVEKASLLSKG